MTRRGVVRRRRRDRPFVVALARPPGLIGPRAFNLEPFSPSVPTNEDGLGRSSRPHAGRWSGSSADSPGRPEQGARRRVGIQERERRSQRFLVVQGTRSKQEPQQKRRRGIDDQARPRSGTAPPVGPGPDLAAPRPSVSQRAPVEPTPRWNPRRVTLMAGVSPPTAGVAPDRTGVLASTGGGRNGA